MSLFDATGGPWGYRLRHAFGMIGVDLYIKAGTFNNQPLPALQGTIPDQSVYVGPMADGTTTYIARHNWFNQGAQYRAQTANYPAFGNIAVVDYYHLQALSAILPELIVAPGGAIDLAALLPLLTDPLVAGSEYHRRQLLSLLSGCAATDAQRNQLADALVLEPEARSILVDHGVLLQSYVGAFTNADYDTIDQTLDLFPLPVKDQLHVLIMDESLWSYGSAGTYGSGGAIILSVHAGTIGAFAPYPSGVQLPNRDSFQNILIHEMGHMCDAASVGLETGRYETIYAAGATDPDAFLYGTVYPLPGEDIIFYFLGYCTDSATIVGEVAARGNSVLTQKLSHTIDLLPSLAPYTAPFFTTDPTTHLTTVTTVPVTRTPPAYLGDDGMITSVNGIPF